VRLEHEISAENSRKWYKYKPITRVSTNNAANYADRTSNHPVVRGAQLAIPLAIKHLAEGLYL
jgi:hypothetical protein